MTPKGSSPVLRGRNGGNTILLLDGKTQIAMEYAYQHRQDYQAVFWTLADTRESLVSGYIAMAQLLELPQKDDQDQAVIVQAVKSWLQTHSLWLLILDNADELVMVRECVPPSFGGYILLTTRAQSMGRFAKAVEVETMSLDVGALFLLHRAGRVSEDASLDAASSSDVAMAKEISEELGGLPLALDQAGAYIEETTCSLSEYLSLYRERRAELLKERGGIVSDHPEAVASTWSLSFKKIEEKNAAAAELLRCCAYLAPDAIPEEMLIAGAQHLGPLLAPIMKDGGLFNNAIAALNAYSLIRRDAANKTLSMHRLVQAVLLDFMPEQERTQRIERIITATRQIFPSIMRQIFPSSADEVQQENADTSRFLQGEPLIPHVFTLIKHISSWTTLPQELAFSLARLLYDLACYLRVHPRPIEATSLYEQILRIQKPDDLPSIFSIRQGLAALYITEGKYKEAERHLLICLHCAEPIPAALSSWKANLLNALATCYHEQGRYEEAVQLYERIEEQEPSLTLNNATSKYNQAIAYKNQRRHKEAEELHQRVLHFREQALGANHPDVAVSLSSLAVLYLEQDRFSEAEPLFQRSLRIKEQAFGPAHPEMASPMFNLANLYAKQGRYAEAEALYRRSLLIWEQALGPNHPNAALILRNMATTCGAQGKYGEAEQLCRRALTIYEQADHQDASIARILLATIRISLAKEKNEH